MSLGHSTARNLSRMECLKLCMVHPSGTCCCNHLFNAALAELVLVVFATLYLGKANADVLVVDTVDFHLEVSRFSE